MRPLLPVLLALTLQAAEHEGPERLVKLTVAATEGKTGSPVNDLNQSDVQITEDGKPRNIAYFHFTGAQHRVPAPPTVILLDRWNEFGTTAASGWFDVIKAVKSLETTDGFYIYLLDNHGELVPLRPIPVTEAAAHAPAPSPEQLGALLDDAFKKSAGFRSVEEKDPGLRANVTIKALFGLGSQMASISGRKNLIWVTHGFPIEFRLPGHEFFDLTPQIRNASQAAAESNILIYSVDQSAQGAGASVDGLSRQTLQTISNLTGGRWRGSGDTGGAVTAALADNRGSYTIAYFSPVEADKKYHKIRLTSPRKDVRFQTRDGYFGDPPPTPEAVQNALLGPAWHSPFDATDIGLRATTSHNEAGNSTRFSIQINPADIMIDHAGSKYEAKLTLASASYTDGKLERASTPLPIKVDLSQEEFDKAQKDGITVNVDLNIPPTIQKLRLAVFDRELYSLGTITLTKW